MTDEEEGTLYPMRLQKFLARAGAASRRGSENLMTAGRVTVNGSIVTELGTKVDPKVDIVAIDGKRISLADSNAYIMLNKPAGYVTTMSDPQGRPCVASLVPIDRWPALFPVGRLDCDTTGLLLFTTDGELAYELLHPKYHVEKRYEAVVDGRVAQSELEPLRRGIVLDGKPCKPAKVNVVQPGPTSKVTCIISEGRKRQVKKMFAAIHHPVLMLNRASFGPLVLGDLPLGSWRQLTADEVETLKSSVPLEARRPQDVQSDIPKEDFASWIQ